MIAIDYKLALYLLYTVAHNSIAYLNTYTVPYTGTRKHEITSR